ncbi:MAG TPA: MBL fold metallo-hydrolase [Stellaceae bacterium]|nr:MBL fold metallo-hydrolase [Stellaceae bacterium]
MRLSFHGAARSVTGSCHLLEVAGRRILVDCGMIQGSRDLDEENAAEFGFDPHAIDFVVLTHAHLDHCGRLPLLVKRGFRGEIVATAATRNLARLVLLDAAHVQEEDSRRRQRRVWRRGGKGDEEPLYTLLDVFDTLDRFGRKLEYRSPLVLAPGVRVTAFDAGHILGSASVLIEAEAAGAAYQVLFSGDIGNSGRPLLASPSVPEAADIVVMESTYGDRRHRPFAATVEEFYEAITDTFARGGNVIIPTFALERAQELLFVLRQGIEQSRLPPSMMVFLDSPMAIAATEIFRRHPDCYGPSVGELFAKGRDPFGFPGLRFTRETGQSMAINRISGGAIIMAGSGMCTGGRVCHHLRHNLWREEASVIFVGFAASGTLARRIIDGASEVDLFGEPVSVRSRIHTINGFSAHADQQELVDWRGRVGVAGATFLVHGEESAMTALAAKLADSRIEMPRLHEAFPF